MPADAMRRTVTQTSLRYAAGLTFAHLLSVTEVIVIVAALSGRTPGNAYFTEHVTAAAALAFACAVIVPLGGALIIRRSLRWFGPGRAPTARERRAAMNLIRDQSLLLAAIWVLGGLIFILFHLDGGAGLAISTGFAVVFGGAAATGTAVLLSQRTVRPIVAAAARGFDGFVTAPSVLARLINMWLLSSGLPCLVIAVLVLFQSKGWIIPRTASVEIPVLVLSLVAVMLGWRGMILASRSIADPIHEVVDAMAEIEHGHIGTLVDVYERSEIGRLQSGFNRMVAGLNERDRLRDLFGRYVGADVARRAVRDGAALSGEVSEAAILFVDLADSTQLMMSRPPQEVAEVLNDFFRIVVGAVDERQGLINKFQGDAVLAVFGVPLRSTDAASAALATARSLAVRLRRLPLVDFGIGVSAGSVFAGNIGAENRFEYTVIGDAVNEAARLADLAKTSAQRALCSAAAIDRADQAECRLWASHGAAVLRGRSAPTHTLTPCPADQSGGAQTETAEPATPTQQASPT